MVEPILKSTSHFHRKRFQCHTAMVLKLKHVRWLVPHHERPFTLVLASQKHVTAVYPEKFVSILIINFAIC